MIDSSNQGIVCQNWGWRYAGRHDWALSGINLTVAPGERVWLKGPSGGGKSTLLKAIAGLLGAADEGEASGSLTIDGLAPVASRQRTALVMQDPVAQIILARVGDDVAFGAENICLPPEEIWPSVQNSLDAVNLTVELDNSTAELSGGQEQRLVIAGVLVMGPDWLLLDEPTANLDSDGVRLVHQAVERIIADRKRGLIIVEHRNIWEDLIDRVFELPSPKSAPSDHHLPANASTSKLPLKPRLHLPGVSKRQADDFILKTTGLAIGYGQTRIKEDISFRIPRGISTIITGPNGCGKTTLALTLAGLLPKLAGQVEVAEDLSSRGLTDPYLWKSRELLTRIGTVFQSPEHQFVTASVTEELAVGLKALKQDKDSIKTTVNQMLETLHLTHLAQANPFTLSGGEKRRLSVGTVLATNPSLIFLDEPTFGQDRQTWADLVKLITHLLDQGTTVVSITHDQDYLAALGENIIALEALP